MPLPWRRTIDLVAFIMAAVLMAAVLAMRLKFELNYYWPATICSAVALALPSIVARLWTKCSFLRKERTATEMRCRHRLHSRTAEVG